MLGSVVELCCLRLNSSRWGATDADESRRPTDARRFRGPPLGAGAKSNGWALLTENMGTGPRGEAWGDGITGVEAREDASHDGWLALSVACDARDMGRCTVSRGLAWGWAGVGSRGDGLAALELRLGARGLATDRVLDTIDHLLPRRGAAAVSAAMPCIQMARGDASSPGGFGCSSACRLASAAARCAALSRDG